MNLEELVASQMLPDNDAAAQRFPLHRNASPTSDAAHRVAMENLAFGKTFGDHMAVMEWDLDHGWNSRRVEAFGPLSLSPAAAVLHYSQEIFEGMKAFRWEDGSVWMFRPGFNSARLNQSAVRMAMPQVELDDFIGSIVQMVRADSRWVPDAPNTSLYLRPFMISTEAFLGVRAAHEYLYAVISSPVGAFFKGGLSPVSIWVTKEFHRAAPGGTGAAKTGGNYAASLLPQRMADERGFEQVCYLDAKSATYLEELGGMNIFAVTKDGDVLTPRLTGTILEGGTRAAIIQLFLDRGIVVKQIPIALDDLVNKIEEGEITELFACGTAAIITPIGRLGSLEFDLTLPGGNVATSVYEQLAAIQRGEAPDPHGWMYRIL